MFIVIHLFIPYLFYFSLFILYSTYFHKEAEEDNDGNWEGFGIANTLSVVALFIFIVYFGYYEARQILYHKLEYFYSFWNCIDMSSLIINFITLVMDLAGMEEKYMIPLYAWAVLIMWLKLFYFGRIFLSTAAMIRMVLEITYDMKFFLLVLIISIAAFGNCFMIIARNYDKENMFTGNNYFRSFIYAYNQALGNFDTESYENTDKYYLYLIWFLNTMVTLILFLNLLIAIMGDTFDRVQETTENNMLKELANIMVENEQLLDRKKVFGDAKYIIIIQSERAEESNVSWEGRLQHLKKYMDRKVIEQNKLLRSLEECKPFLLICRL
jgi:membrane-associated HD superfamily phosphohydrolase